MKEIVDNSHVFEGPPDRLAFSHSTRLLADGTYRTMGRLLALSLTQGGPSLPCLAVPVYQYWTGLPVNKKLLTVDMISDFDLQQNVKAVSSLCNFFNCAFYR